MRHECRVVFCAIAGLALATARPAGQETVDIAPPPSARFPAAWYPPDNDVTSTMAPVKGAPYEARMVMDDGAGNRSTGPASLYARDSEGRTRTEAIETRTEADGKLVKVHAVEVNDAVTHCMFHWTEPWLEKNSPAATVSCMPRRLHYDTQPMWSSVVAMSQQPGDVRASPQEMDHNESLGTRTFDGVRAIGVRHTRTFRDGQSTQLRSLVTDFWVSPEMKEVVAMRVPPNGYVLELRGIQLHEPDAKLFYPPAGYRVDAMGKR